MEVSCPSSQDNVNDVHNVCDNSLLIDLYAVGDNNTMWGTLRQKGAPFVHWVILHRPQGEKVRVKSLFDGGAVVAAMCTSVFKKNQHRLHRQTKLSNRCLRMANGSIVHSQVVWKGILELGGIRADGEFKVFDSRGSWDFLFGKPLLHHFKALHDFDTDTVTIRSAHESVQLCNSTENCTPKTPTGISLTLDVEQQELSVGGSLSMNPPSRQVPQTDISTLLVQNDESHFISGCTDDALGRTEEYP